MNKHLGKNAFRVIFIKVCIKFIIYVVGQPVGVVKEITSCTKIGGLLEGEKNIYSAWENKKETKQQQCA